MTAEVRSPETRFQKVINASVCPCEGLLVTGSGRFIFNSGARKPDDCNNLIISVSCVSALGMNSAAPRVTRSAACGLMDCESWTGTVELLSVFCVFRVVSCASPPLLSFESICLAFHLAVAWKLKGVICIQFCSCWEPRKERWREH